MKTSNLSLICCLLCFSLFAQDADDYFKVLKYRNIGPFRGGRSVTASGDVNDPLTYYMGTTGGGLWKTQDAGQHWNNISDGFFKTGSVGAISVSESNPNILYCGMGEHAVRGVMTSYGDGIYKSTDAGKTWKHIGLEKTQHISRIVIHPTNPQIVYVAAQGALYGPNNERGIYKTIDGGKTWKNMLFVNERTGGVELSMDVNSPNVIYAAMWEHQRKPWKIISGGQGSGLYKSIDGGETWSIIHNGLPKEKGKMAIAVARSNSDKVYALIESDSDKDLGGLFVSNNGGKNWSMISGDNRLTQRAWYYTEVFVDPNDDETIYVLSAPALRSKDGGVSWEIISGTHGDYHDLWINPTNSKNMVIANDGGAAISFNHGASWSTQSIMPTAQIYRINADNLFPYNIYGGQQDNSSIKIANLSLGSGGIGQKDWSPSAGGESAFLAFDPDDPKHVMGGSYLGTIELLDTEAKAGTNIMAAPIQYLGREARNMKYLYNWNAPIIWSKHEPGTFFHCAQKVLRTTDNGLTWEEFSPDLTRDIEEKQGNGGGPYTNEAVGAENYGTIAYMVESPHEKGVFLTGSDDGLVHITRDNGLSWNDITPKGLGEALVNAIEVSPHDPKTIYLATTKYKFNDYTPGLYKSTDYGKSWAKINLGIPNGAYTRVVREDQERKDLLFAGTETGIYISWNGGKAWEAFQLNLPVTPINDLKVHKGDLIVATSGRSFWILDDLALLRQYQGKSSTTEIYQPESKVYGNWFSPLDETNPNFNGMSDFEGVNPANGIVIYYNLPEDINNSEIILNIKNADNELIRTITSSENKNYKRYDGGPPPSPNLSNEKGLNRFVWDLRHPLISGVNGVYIEGSYRGHKVSPGTYTLELNVGSKTYSSTATVLDNPLFKISKEQFDNYDVIMSDMEGALNEMHASVNQLNSITKQLKTIIAHLEDDELISKGKDLIDKIGVWDSKMVQRKSKAYDDVENFPNKFTAEYLFLINQTESSLPRVNRSSIDRKAELDLQWNSLKRDSELLLDEVSTYNKLLWEAGIGAITF
ncbi:VPS10 domain-containing protein [Winogradskyella alexanderae]|uniref:Glycosyl hydrolase n=1 Tax=Winogradskyella alexanderae TaxID=2877123 RepID=A0ABS7XV13_9FLAO|nr:glycosyl hydrolase [Winogradskyella alexanderae]MCA0133865.1 glycosyl hydrolase [Winogradskyella alexanderae]